MKEAARGRMLGTDGARVKDANGSNETGGAAPQSYTSVWGGSREGWDAAGDCLPSFTLMMLGSGLPGPW